MSAAERPELRRTERKRIAITEAATERFLAAGYRGTSMDEIAAAAGVSKQTLYKQFSDKAQLFTDVVEAMVNAAGDPVHDAVQGLEATGHLETDLRAIARRQLELVLQPSMMRLRRLVIAESDRFRELGRVFYEQGPARTIDALADALTKLADAGQLRIDDPHVAAAQLNWLVMSEPLNQAMLLGLDAVPPPADLDRWAATGVATFLAAYGRGRDADDPTPS